MLKGLMMNSEKQAPAHRIRDILLQARAQHGQEAVLRLEDAFLRATGFREPARSPHPLQNPSLYYPGLRATPWVDPDWLAGVAILEKNFETIRDEVFGVRDSGFQKFDDGTPHTGKWAAFYLRFGARPVENNRPLCPRTTEIVNNLPRVGEMAMVSALNPGAHIEPHCGLYNFRLTAHLGLRIPPGCEFRVGDEIRQWKEGQCLVFDDSFEHEVWNRGSATRFILLVDFWHPDLSDVEIHVLNQIENVMGSARSRLDDNAKELETARWWA